MVTGLVSVGDNNVTLSIRSYANRMDQADGTYYYANNSGYIQTG
ncbi:MAG: hypothetical protein ACLR43_02025 [Faecalibacillus faecis]